MSTLFDSAEEAGTYERPARPPYKVPLVREIHDLLWNGLVSVSSFSGCGGSGTGFRMAGWRVPYAIEFIPAAADSYAANSSAFVDRRDIREIKGSEILERLGIRRGELDCYEGSAPCASFSSAGSGQKDWGKTKRYSDSAQRTDDLFFEFCRLLDELHPRSFVAENVPGLIRGAALEEYAHRITQLMGELGYRVRAQIMNAANYGVPQTRRRLIFIGIRADLGIEPTFPEPSTPEAYTVRDALEAVEEDYPEDIAESSMEGKAVGRTWYQLKAAQDGGYEVDFTTLPCERCGKPLTDHRLPVASGDTLTWVPLYEMTADQQRSSPGITSAGAITKAICDDGERAILTKSYFLEVLPDLDKPCPTITATGSQVGAASVVHPLECRKFTPAELRAICGFPSDFTVVGTRDQRYERYGRAVPPPLYAAVAGHLAGLLKGEA